MSGTLRASSRPETTQRRRLLASDSALSLLARSIDFGHGRLAVVRLAMAVSAGAEVPQEHWAYCANVAHDSADRRLQDMYFAAAHRAKAVTCA